MKVGLIGYPLTGKTTLFRAASRGTTAGDVAAVPVPDERFDTLARLSESKKLSPAHVDFQDNVGRFSPGEGKAAARNFLDAARKMDVLLHVVRAFDNPMAPYHTTVNPLRDHRGLEEELILEDLALVETRLGRLAKSMAAHQSGSAESNEWRLLEKLKGSLEGGTALRAMELGEEEEKLASGFQFLSDKPLVCALNVGEDKAAADAETEAPDLAAYCCERHIPCAALCASYEEEVATLDEGDQKAFLEEAGLAAPAAHRLIRAVYDATEMITFFTTGPKETRAWPIRKGATALDAAGTIHSDLARGFIRAEIASYEDCVAAGGWDQVHAAGKTALYGKEYVMRDGEIIVVRFKV